MIVEMRYIAHQPLPEPEFGLAFYRQDGVHVSGPNTRLGGLKMGTVQGVGVVRYCIDNLPLLPARYQVTAAIHDSRRAHAFDYHEEAYGFQVEAGANKDVYGLLELPATWSWEPAASEPD